MRMLKQRVKEAVGAELLGRLDYYRFPKYRASWGGPFNGQQHRRRMFTDILAVGSVRAVVETGTFRGTTTEFMASVAPLPIFTVEYDRRNLGYSRQRLMGRSNVAVAHGDSRAFLRRLVDGDSLPDGVVLFYLDAHWGEDLPLAEELDIVFAARSDAIVMVDDFMVPGDPGYTFDDYGPGKALTADYIAPAVARFDLAVFYPAVGSQQETGARRGSVVLARDSDVVSRLARLPSLRAARPAGPVS